MTRTGLLALWTASNALLMSWMAVSLLLKSYWVLLACLLLAAFNFTFVALHWWHSRERRRAAQQPAMSPGQDWILAARRHESMTDGA